MNQREETCPVCHRNLSETTYGFYAVDSIIQKVCVGCIKKKQKTWMLVFFVTIIVTLVIGYFIFF